jgi:hypothetical protein
VLRILWGQTARIWTNSRLLIFCEFLESDTFISSLWTRQSIWKSAQCSKIRAKGHIFINILPNADARSAINIHGIYPSEYSFHDPDPDV